MLDDSKNINAFIKPQNSKLMGVVGSGIKNVLKNTNSESQDNERQDVKTLDEMKAIDCGVLISNITKTQDAKKYERICKNLNEESKKKFDDLSLEDQKAILTIFNINLDDPIDSTPVPPQLAPASPMPSPVPLSPIDEVPLPPPLPPIDEVPLPPPLPVIDEVPLPPPLPAIDDFPQPPLPIATFSMPSPAPLIDLPQSLSFNKNKNNTILNNLIEIFTNDAYSDLKNYYRKNASNEYLNLEVLKNCQVCDINNYLSKTNLSVEDFFKKDSNFKNIMSAISNANLENEEIKNQVKENLYELANNKNLKEESLSRQDAACIIKFLTNENKKIEIMEKMEILNQLKIFDKYDYSYSGYNVKKLEIFNTLVNLIPKNESFVDYKDKIIDCINTSVKDRYKAYEFLEDVLKPNIETIKGKDYKTLLDRMIKCPYSGCSKELYCDVIIDKKNKYQNISPFILSLILQHVINKIQFEDLYDKYLPILQKADDKTLSNMTGDMLPYLAQFRSFLNEIQVNEEADISLESLSFQQLKELKVFLIKNDFNHSFKDVNINFINKNLDKIFIKKDNEIDYASTLSEVNKLLSGKHLDLPQIQKDNINNILKVKDDLANIDFEKIKIDKTNKFEILKSNVENILENDNSICDSDKNIILARLTNDIDSLMFNELPQDLNQREVVKKIREKVSEYLTFNKVQNEENTYTIGDAKISGMDYKTKSTLESIFKAIPELVVLLGVNQGRGRFDIGKHILAVGKEVVKNDKFQNLSQDSQKLVLIAALMHDIAKMDGGHDASHPQRGSQYAYNMLSGALSDDDKATVANLIFNHHFGQSIANDENDDEKMYALAYECKDENPEFLNMLEILGEADLLGDAESYKKMTKDYLEQIPGRIETLTQKVKTINDILAKLKKTLDLTPFPQKTEDSQTAMQKCKELGIVGEFKLGDIKIDKIDLAKMKNLSPEEQKERLSLLGFYNTEYNQLEFLIHAVENGKQVGGIDYLTSQFKPDSTLSTSIITMANTETFNCRQYGFIMEPDKTKVLAAKPGSMFSGYVKSRNRSAEFIHNYKTDEDYKALSNYIKNSRLSSQKESSELITIDNEVAAIFVKKDCEDNIPKELVEFAYKNNLPLIVVPRPEFEDEEET